MDRREFLILPGALAAGSLLDAAPVTPWHQKVHRVGQTNMTERDMVDLNIEQWADYWASAKVDALLVSVTGILAYYPTKVPFHRRGQFLGDRDFFGECCTAAKKRGIRVIARMSPDLNWEDAVQAHPEWFEKDAQGNAVRHNEDHRLFRTCMFSTYYTEFMTAIMREINQRYDVDGHYTNAWPPLGRPPACYCEQCKRLARPGTIEYWEQFNQRVLYLWKLYDGIAKEKKPDSLFYGNLGGNVRATPDLKQLAEVCQWFNCDNQGRGGDDTPIWGCSQQGRVCYSVMKGRTTTNVTGGWSTGGVRWRNAAKSPAEETMWFDETVASGMVIWYSFIGAQTGMGEDHRWEAPAREYFNWLAKHDRHFNNKRTIANLGVVYGQRTHLFYRPPGNFSAQQYVDGLYYALLEGRFLFDFVHEEDLGAENLKKYTALILPNTALLSDEQCRQLKAYVDGGGSLLATFETGMYDERNKKRTESGLADVFGIQRAGEIRGTLGNAFYARIERQHEILKGFTDTNWIPGAEYRLPVKAVDAPVLTVVPGYVSYPPELSYPPTPHTTEPAVVIREKGRSRLVYFPGDVDRTLWHSGHTDISRLLQNSVRWVLHGESPVTIEGSGVVEAFVWETEPGFAIHVLNYTNPNMHRGWIREYYPIGEQKVKMKLPPGRRVTRVELLRSERAVPFRVTGGELEFTIPRVVDYEVAAVE
ncbi:MAG: beta-galactosidase trimerization domain-containing protein [Candidatus Sulfopaludibacter sp.]|nr:beta-galactosidase trimerization domain-containing protein [Candidatus Sulfopaludibacter sp.]